MLSNIIPIYTLGVYKHDKGACQQFVLLSFLFTLLWLDTSHIN